MSLHGRIKRLEAMADISDNRPMTPGELKVARWQKFRGYLEAGGDLDAYEDQDIAQSWRGYTQLIEELAERRLADAGINLDELGGME